MLVEQDQAGVRGVAGSGMRRGEKKERGRKLLWKPKLKKLKPWS